MNQRTATQSAIKRATVAAHRDMDRLDARMLAELKALYEQAAGEIGQDVRAQAGADDNLTLAELKNLLAQVNARLDTLSSARDRILDGGLGQAAELGVSPVAPAIPATVAAASAAEAVRFVRSFVAADGLQLSDRIWRLDRQARETVTSAIERAVVSGHGAGQAARDFLSRGEPVPDDIQNKINAANAVRLSKTARDLMIGAGSPLDNAMRLFRTEINRAHGEAYIKGAMAHPEAIGVRFLLSPAHPEHDICDLHATANLHGLGPGVYPDRESCPWPAHPNTLSYVEVVFRDEVTEADRQGKETPMQAIERLTPAQQRGILGAHKHAAFKDGKLTQGMIKAPWREVQPRIDRNIGRTNLFQWGEAKRARNIERRGLDFIDAPKVFAGDTYTFIDRREDYGETRWVTFGKIYGRPMVVVHVQRGNETRIISYRKANAREQAHLQNRLEARRSHD